MGQNIINTLNPVVQTVSSNTNTIIPINATIPLDNTIPQRTEGVEVITCSITPRNTNNLLYVNIIVTYATSIGCGNIVCALFQDLTANALTTYYENFSTTIATCGTFNGVYIMPAGTTSATTFKLRMGVQDPAHPAYVNASGVGGAAFGGTLRSYMIITEYMDL